MEFIVGIWKENHVPAFFAGTGTEDYHMGDITTFKRREIKYLLEEEKYKKIMAMLKTRLVEDEHGKSTICNVYYDTPDYRIIRKSLEKPVYKEKLRLRSYGVVPRDGKVFVELKKKYKGIVYKRREVMTLEQSEEYLNDGKCPKEQTQIIREIDWFMHYYENLAPAMYISYEREAYYSVEYPDLRITFDENIMYRPYDMELSVNTGGMPILRAGQHLMEVKAGGAIPVWLTEMFDELEIFPTSFSKYGRAYMATALIKED